MRLLGREIVFNYGAPFGAEFGTVYRDEPKRVHVKLNGDHTAIISKMALVGQEFSYEDMPLKVGTYLVAKEVA